MLKLFAIALTLISALPAIAQQPTPQPFPNYAPWMLAKNQPGFSEQLANAPVIVANYTMQMGTPLIVVACTTCTLTLPPCKPGTILQAIAVYAYTLSGPEPAVQPQGADVWVINQTTGQLGVSFARTMAPYETATYIALPTQSGCQWQLS